MPSNGSISSLNLNEPTRSNSASLRGIVNLKGPQPNDKDHAGEDSSPDEKRQGLGCGLIPRTKTKQDHDAGSSFDVRSDNTKVLKSGTVIYRDPKLGEPPSWCNCGAEKEINDVIHHKDSTTKEEADATIEETQQPGTFNDSTVVNGRPKRFSNWLPALTFSHSAWNLEDKDKADGKKPVESGIEEESNSVMPTMRVNSEPTIVEEPEERMLTFREACDMVNENHRNNNVEPQDSPADLEWEPVSKSVTNEEAKDKKDKDRRRSTMSITSIKDSLKRRFSSTTPTASRFSAHETTPKTNKTDDDVTTTVQSGSAADQHLAEALQERSSSSIINMPATVSTAISTPPATNSTRRFTPRLSRIFSLPFSRRSQGSLTGLDDDGENDTEEVKFLKSENARLRSDNDELRIQLEDMRQDWYNAEQSLMQEQYNLWAARDELAQLRQRRRAYFP